MRVRRFIHVILLLGVCGLAWQVFLAWGHTRPPIMVEPSRGLNKTPPSFPQVGSATGQKLIQVITAKNLFAPDRRTEKKKPPQKEKHPAVPPPKHLKLVGVFLAGERREALFADSSKGGRVIRVISGDTLGSYHLTRLTHSEATLALGTEGQEVSLPLDTQKSTDAARTRRIAPARPDASNSQTSGQEPQPTTENSTLGADSSATLILGADSGQPAASRVKQVAADSGQDEAVSLRQNIRQLQRRLREIRRQRARERRKARSEERAE